MSNNLLHLLHRCIFSTIQLGTFDERPIVATDETLDKIVTFLAQSENGISSLILAEQFLAFKGANEKMADMLVNTILKKSPLAWKGESGLWFAKAVSSPLISQSSFLICYPLLSNDRRSIIQIALIKLTGDDHELLYSTRLESTEESLIIRGEKVVCVLHESFPQIVSLFREQRLIFPASYEQRILLKYLLDAGFSIPDDALLLSHLFKMAKIPMTGKNGGVESLAKEYIEVPQEPVTAADFAELTASLAEYCITKIQESGAITTDQFDEQENRETLRANWTRAQFTLEHILELENRPGVYGYLDQVGNYIYIGKGANVRTRLLTYFRESDESPTKLLQLRDQAVTFTCHYCGNELESLILESRLIRKYAPLLNTQVDLHITDSTDPVPPGIYLLPAQTEEQCYTLWYNGKGSVTAKTLNRSEPIPFTAAELESFFFTATQTEPSQETLIARRWLRPRFASVNRIDTESVENSEEMVAILAEALLQVEDSETIYR